MTKQDYNRDYFCVFIVDGVRSVIGYDTLVSNLSKNGVIYRIFRQLESNLLQKLIVRPFHGQTYIFYRH